LVADAQRNREAAMNLNDLDTFSRVARLGSFAAAARELGVPKSTISRRVDRLEDELNAALLLRSARGLTLTDVGASLHARSETALREINEIEHSLTASEPRGVLKIAAPHDLGTSPWFVDLLVCFRGRYPEVELDLHLAGQIVDLIGEGFDVALRPARVSRDSDQIMIRKIGGVFGGLYAGPAYLERKGRPRRISDIDKHEGVTARALKDRPWRFFKGDEVYEGRPRIVAVSDDFSFVREAAVAGMGLAFLPPVFAREAVEEGSLVRVLPKWTSERGQLAVVWPRSRHMAPRVRAFLDFFVERFEQVIAQ
jgi:DNA-binding transcriptional LysR family regulator